MLKILNTKVFLGRCFAIPCVLSTLLATSNLDYFQNTCGRNDVFLKENLVKMKVILISKDYNQILG